VISLFFTLMVIMGASLLLCESAYRWQVMDTYLPELREYNLARDLSGDDPRKTILIMGDSFTAGKNSYPSLLREKLPHYRVINSGVTGTGIIETSILAPNRLKQFRPAVVIYQVYVGNDLLNISFPINWRELPFHYNLYWYLSDRLRFLGFLNYRLAQTRFPWQKTGQPLPSFQAVAEQEFSVTRYNQRFKMYVQGDPHFLNDTIMVKNRRVRDYRVQIKKMLELVRACEPYGCRVYFLVIPHSCQVNQKYLAQAVLLGVIFDDPALATREEYPFLKNLQAEFAGQDKVAVLNPIRLLKEREKAGVRVYYQNDEHLTAAGQKAIASFLLQEANLAQ